MGPGGHTKCSETNTQLPAIWAHSVRLHALLAHARLAVHALLPHALLPHALLAIHSLLPAAQSGTHQCKGRSAAALNLWGILGWPYIPAACSAAMHRSLQYCQEGECTCQSWDGHESTAACSAAMTNRCKLKETASVACAGGRLLSAVQPSVWLNTAGSLFKGGVGAGSGSVLMCWPEACRGSALHACGKAGRPARRCTARQSWTCQVREPYNA